MSVHACTFYECVISNMPNVCMQELCIHRKSLDPQKQPCFPPPSPPHSTHPVLLDRASHKDDHSLPLILVLPVLEGQLSDLHCCREVGLALHVYLGHAVQHPSEVLRGRDQHLRRLASHGQDAHCVLGVRLGLGPGQEVHGIGLGGKPRGHVVTAPRVLTVVH